MKETKIPFFDDLDSSEHVNNQEDEADEKALAASLSKNDWSKYIGMLDTPNSVLSLANKLGISPAIIAGRYRKDTGNYRIFNRLIGSNQVRDMVF